MRAAMAAFTLVLVSFIVFTLMELVPGDCAERYVAFKNTQGASISVADIEAERVRLGLDRPYLERWGSWIVNAFQGDFGASCILRVDIAQLLGDKFTISLAICLTSLLLAYLIAIPVGIISATTNNAVLNNALRFLSYFGLAMPNFLLALVIMLASTIWYGDSMTGLFSKEYRDAEWSYDRVVDFLSRAWLPVFILGLVGDGVRAADGARADVRRDRQASTSRPRARAACTAGGCSGDIPPGTRSARSSTRSAST